MGAGGILSFLNTWDLLTWEGVSAGNNTSD